MRAPPIFIVVHRHADFHGGEYRAWFFDRRDAEEFAERQPKTEWSGCQVEEVPAVDPMPKERW
jgi:hypothetical protein